MVRKERNCDSEFIKYTEYIAKHPNYKGLSEIYKKDGSIRWVVSGNSKIGEERAEWWDKKVKELDAPNRAEVARIIHPKELNRMKPCQICGRKLSIDYVYPDQNAIKQLNKLSELEFKKEDFETIEDIYNQLFEIMGNEIFNNFRRIFKIPDHVAENKDEFIIYIVESRTKMSPGVMSNPPDRLDGFHSYNACCRNREDTGRHKENLVRYSQDRRAYENWSEGNWHLSNRLMGEFNRYPEKVECPKCGKKKKMTADHIGPISLGFTHRPKFNPLCKSCNSSKNNRMSYSDIKQLINDENKGEKVISWHTEYLWKNLKNEVKNDKDAFNLSKILREHMDNVLKILAIISTNNHKEFLCNFLNPEYSFYDYKFNNFNPLKLDELEIIKTPLSSKNRKKNAQRYIRISFESLDDYASKENRKLGGLDNKYMVDLTKLLKTLEKKDYVQGKKELEDLIIKISKDEIEEFNHSE